MSREKAGTFGYLSTSTATLSIAEPAYQELRAQKKEAPTVMSRRGFEFISGNVLLSHSLPGAVPSALEALTTVFGTGTGVTPPL
jgi:hypothetical protein